MSVPVTDPIIKAHERAHQMRSVERKLRRVAKRESMARHIKRAKDILAEFGLDDSVEHLVIDLPVPKQTETGGLTLTENNSESSHESDI
jgi:hypothetical protein